MNSKKSNQVTPEVLAEARKKSQEFRSRFSGKPEIGELLTAQEISEASPFYFILRCFIKQLKTAREDAKLTLAEVSARSGIAVESLSRLETGAQTNPTWKTLGNYAIAVGMAPKLVAIPELTIRNDAGDQSPVDTTILKMSEARSGSGYLFSDPEVGHLPHAISN